MIDPTSAAILAIAHADSGRFPLVACAGMITSIGPCVAPRYIALASVLHGPRRALTVFAFVAGIVTVYLALGFGSGVLIAVTQHAAAIDLLLALALAAGGLVTLLRRTHQHGSAETTAATRRGTGAVFCMGAASALVMSPCCTPIVAAVVAFPAIDQPPVMRALLLGTFALGHAAPLLALSTAGALIPRRIRRWNAGSAPAVISGTLMLALGAYYGLIA